MQLNNFRMDATALNEIKSEFKQKFHKESISKSEQELIEFLVPFLLEKFMDRFKALGDYNHRIEERIINLENTKSNKKSK